MAIQKETETFKATLVFARTEYDPINMWTATKQVSVNLPASLLDKNDMLEWHLVGMDYVNPELVEQLGANCSEPKAP